MTAVLGPNLTLPANVATTDTEHLSHCVKSTRETRQRGARLPRVPARRAREPKQAGAASTSRFSPDAAGVSPGLEAEPRCLGRLAGPRARRSPRAGRPAPGRAAPRGKQVCAQRSPTRLQTTIGASLDNKVQKRRTCADWTRPGGEGGGAKRVAQH